MPTKPITRNSSDIPSSQRIISVLWPSFLTAMAATVLFFAAFSPTELALLMGYPDLSPLAGYTLGFFFLWVVAAVSSWISLYFARPCLSQK